MNRRYLFLLLLLPCTACREQPTTVPTGTNPAPPKHANPTSTAQPPTPTRYHALKYRVTLPGNSSLEDLAAQLVKRFDPHQTRGIKVLPLNTDRLHILLPGDPTDDVIAHVQHLARQPGHLEFRITAHPHYHRQLLAASSQSPPADSSLVHGTQNMQLLGKWVTLAREHVSQDGPAPYLYVPLGDVIRDAHTGQPVTLDHFDTQSASPGLALALHLQQAEIDQVELLVSLQDGFPVDDTMLTSATALATDGQSAIDLTFTKTGTAALAELTARYAPPPGKTPPVRLAVILDGRLLTAPRILEPINSTHALITGNFSAQTAENLAAILNSGPLPAQTQIEFIDHGSKTLPAPAR